MAKITKDFLLTKVNGITINKNFLSHIKNFLNKSSRDVYYIVMHYTANFDDTALANANYFKRNVVSSSAHFFVDETNIYQTVELRDVAYHCGTTKGYKTNCRNANSFGIEMTTAGNYAVSTQTQINSAYLCAELCKMIGITASTVDTYVLRHYDVGKNNKVCPKQYVENISEWNQFKTWVKNILNTGSYEGKATVANPTPSISSTYTQTQFIKDVQSAIGASVDGMVGSKTLSKLITVSRYKNNRHSVVKALQKRLNALGYDCGTPDGVAGAKFDSAAKAWAKANGCTADGEFTKGGKSWRKILGIA